MTDETYISEAAAYRILRQGDFTDTGARAVLTHSKKQSCFGANYYPLKYIQKRSDDNAAAPEIDANAVQNQD